MNSRVKHLAVLGLTSTLVGLTCPRSVERGVKAGLNGWRSDPVQMAADIIVSCSGQAVGWTIGHDQIGLFMRPLVRMGKGQKISTEIAARLPKHPATPWVIKGLEIATDAARIPLEGRLYARCGMVPDGLAVAVTQPLWTVFETGEKLTGAILHPERVTEPEQLALSVACIYGNLVRYVLIAAFWVRGEQIRYRYSNPLANRMRSVFAR